MTLLSLALGALLPTLIAADLPPLRVPQDEATIGEAVAAILQALGSGLQAPDEIVVGPAPDGAYGPVEIEAPVEGFFLTIRGTGGVVIDGGGVAPGILVDWPLARVEISNLRVRNGAPHGVHRLRGELTLQRCVVEGSLQDGVHLVSDPAVAQPLLTGGSFGALKDVVLARCRIVDSGRHALATADPLAPSSFNNILSVRNCVLEDAAETGVRVAGGQWIVFVQASRIEGTGSHGVEVVAGHNHVHFRRNLLDEVGGNGFEVGPAGGFGLDETAIAENLVRRPAGHGIDGDFGFSATPNARSLEENRILAPGGMGIRVRSGNPEVKGNLIVASGSDGLVIAGSGLTDVEKNRVLRAGNDGLVVSGDDSTLRRNRVLASVGHGVNLSGSTNTLIENLARGSGGFDLSDTGTGNLLTDNDFGTQGP